MSLLKTIIFLRLNVQLYTFLKLNSFTKKHLVGIRNRLNEIRNGVFQRSHGYTRVENPGEGVAHIFASGGQGFPDKTARGVPYFGFYCIFINIFFLICLVVSYIIFPSPLTTRVHLWTFPYECYLNEMLCWTFLFNIFYS